MVGLESLAGRIIRPGTLAASGGEGAVEPFLCWSDLSEPGGLQCPAPADAAKHVFQAWRRFARSALRNDSLLGQLKRGVVVAMTDPLAFKFVDTIRPPCSKCGRPLVLTRIEPEEPGFDLRTYYCAACEDVEVIIAAV
jgi:hypothetical protein